MLLHASLIKGSSQTALKHWIKLQLVDNRYVLLYTWAPHRHRLLQTAYIQEEEPYADQWGRLYLLPRMASASGNN